MKTLLKSILALGLACAASTATALDVSGHWWNTAEPGWGMAVQQREATAFVQLYTYNAQGNPVWYVASCQIENARCAATLYSTSGGAPLPYYTRPTVDPAGAITIYFTSDNTASFMFKIGDGLAWVKDVVKMVF